MSATSVPAASTSETDVVRTADVSVAPAARGRLRSADGLDPASIDRRPIAISELIAFVVVFGVGGFLHFLYELSGFATVAAPIGSVNESTWEHLKLFFWPGLAVAVVQHAYLRHRANNVWAAAGTAAVATAATISIAFYAYVGVVLPIDGKGTLAGTLVTAALGVAVGRILSYRLLVGAGRGRVAERVGIGALLILGAAFVVFTFAPPRLFLFEDFFGYRYTGGFGILADYTDYLVFK